MAGISVDSWNFREWLEFQGMAGISGNGWNFRGMGGISDDKLCV
jgi:hypothetical protein